MKKIFCLLFITCNTVCLYAQLQDVTVTKLLEEANSSRLNEDFIASLQLIDKAIAISKPKNDYTALAYEYAYQSKIFTKNNQIEEAQNAINQSFSFAEKSKDDIANAVALSASSYFYKNNDLLDFSIRDAQKGLTYLKTKKDYSLSSSLYFDIYYAYTNWNKLDKIKEYSRLVLTDAEKSADIKCKIDAYDAMVNYFDASNAQTKSKNDKDSLFYYADKKAFLCEKYPNEMGYTTYATTCMNLASTYFAYLPYNADTKKKIFYYLNLVEQTVDRHPLKYDYLTNVYGLKGACAEQESDLTTAEKYYLIAEVKMLTQKVPYYYTWMNDYNALVNLYEKKKDFEKAFIYQKKLQDVNEKLHNQQQIKNAQKLEIQYEVEKKNAELAVLKERAESRKMQNYLYLGIICITLFGLGFMFRSYHYKLKYSVQREKKLEAKKQEAELQIKLEKEEKVRLKLEQELLSIKQNQLQKEVMANSLQLSRKNEMLQQIKNKINEGESNEINKIIKEEMLIDSDFEETKYQIQQLHPGFFNLLNEKATQKLSQLDMKYCAYLHLQMNTKQIANLLNIEAKSVRVAKYRIKQKLGLDKDDDLDNFLQKIS
jgi:hypothetical protein